MKKLGTYFYSKFEKKISDEINDVATNLDGSKSNQIIFYLLKMLLWE